MSFNLNKKTSNKVLDTPRIFHLPPANDFGRLFVDGLLSKFEYQALKLNPELLGQVTILASNKTLAHQIQEILESYNFFILPRILDLGNLAEIFYDQNAKYHIKVRVSNKFEVISDLETFLLLNRIIKEIQEEGFESLIKVTSFDLAHTLTSLIEELNINNLNAGDLKKLAEEDLPQHLQLNLILLKEVIKRYENFLNKEQLIDKNTKYLLDVKKLINFWKLNPHDKPLVLVGSTGSQLATAQLMKAVTKLPQGLVVLPGLDPHLTERGWNSLTPDHPQYGFLALCKTWGLKGFKRHKIIKSPPWQIVSTDHFSCERQNIRGHLISLLMRPGPVTDEWRTEGNFIKDKLALSMDSVALIEAENLQREAASICVGIKEAVDKGLTAALITPSKLLVRRVTAELLRWNIIPNNSLGVSLGSTDFGIFCRQGALVLDKNFQMKYVIKLLKNRWFGVNCSDHHVYINSMQEMFFKSDESFFDLEGSDWLLQQEKEFKNWFNWLLEIFQEANHSEKFDFLVNIFSNHKQFLKTLMIGYIPNKDSFDKIGELIPLDMIDFPNQVFELLGKHLNVPERVGKVELWEYRKIVENLLVETTNALDIVNKRPDVFIWGTLESRTQHADIFILAGLNEGTWPSYYHDDIWLNRSMRAILGIDLLERKVGLSAHDFQQGAMAKTLILSRSLRDNNVPAVASRWLLRLENLLGGLGEEGKKILHDIKARGLQLTKLAAGLYSSNLLIDELQDEVKCKAVRPAPVPPLNSRPNKLSVTEIETLIKNPYAIYAKRILNLKKIENITNSSDARNKGNLVHYALEQFISENINGLPNRKKSCDLLREKFNFVLENSKVPLDSQSIWKAQFNKRIEEIISLEEKRQLSGKPFALEILGKYKIKLKNKDYFSITAKVDRIDKGLIGFTIYDYKTGQVSKTKLENFSPQLDIEALMFVNASFGNIYKEQELVLSLIGLGGEPKQYDKIVKSENLERWSLGLKRIIEKMKLEMTAFVARSIPSKKENFSDNYEHLSRFGEWNDNDDFIELTIKSAEKESFT